MLHAGGHAGTGGEQISERWAAPFDLRTASGRMGSTRSLGSRAPALLRQRSLARAGSAPLVRRCLRLSPFFASLFFFRVLCSSDYHIFDSTSHSMLCCCSHQHQIFWYACGDFCEEIDARCVLLFYCCVWEWFSAPHEFLAFAVTCTRAAASCVALSSCSTTSSDRSSR